MHRSLKLSLHRHPSGREAAHGPIFLGLGRLFWKQETPLALSSPLESTLPPLSTFPRSSQTGMQSYVLLCCYVVKSPFPALEAQKPRREPTQPLM